MSGMVSLLRKEKFEMNEIKIMYHDPELKRIEPIDIGNWIDLRAAENVNLSKGESAFISLGISVQLPDGYEAHIITRSSAFKTWHIIQTNSMGLIDNSFCGENDIWRLPVYAVSDTAIRKNDRICQFRIVPVMGDVKITEVDHLDNENRGGFGSTGTN